MRAPTAVWPPTQPASASALKPHSSWPVEVRGPWMGNLGSSEASCLGAKKGYKRSWWYLYTGDSSSPIGQVRWWIQTGQCHPPDRTVLVAGTQDPSSQCGASPLPQSLCGPLDWMGTNSSLLVSEEGCQCPAALTPLLLCTLTAQSTGIHPALLA
jgi:hypothetical protein